MKISYERLSTLSPLVKAFCYDHNAWIVGSGAKYLLRQQTDLGEDIDLLIPLHNWPRAMKLITKGAIANSHGGFKLQEGSLSIDIWGGDIGHFFGQIPNKATSQHAVQPETLSILTVEWGTDHV